MAQPTGKVCLSCRGTAGDRSKPGLRTTDQAVRAPEKALRSSSEPVSCAILSQKVGGSAAHLGNIGFRCAQPSSSRHRRLPPSPEHER